MPLMWQYLYKVLITFSSPHYVMKPSTCVMDSISESQQLPAKSIFFFISMHLLESIQVHKKAIQQQTLFRTAALQSLFQFCIFILVISASKMLTKSSSESVAVSLTGMCTVYINCLCCFSERILNRTYLCKWEILCCFWQ